MERKNIGRKTVGERVNVTVDGRTVRMEDAMLVVPTHADALAVNTEGLVAGSLLYVVREAKLYVLDDDGGVFCSAVDGRTLEEDA